jgi:hypothetical protein
VTDIASIEGVPLARYFFGVSGAAGAFASIAAGSGFGAEATGFGEAAGLSPGVFSAPVCARASTRFAYPQPCCSFPSAVGCMMSSQCQSLTSLLEAGTGPSLPYCVPVIVCSTIAKPSIPQALTVAHF